MQKMTRRTMLSAFGLALLATGCAKVAGSGEASPQAGGSGAASEAARLLTVGLTYVPDIQFAPLYMAEVNGWFSEAGLNVKLRHHGAQEKLLGALQTGDEDVVFAGAGEMMQGRSQGIPVRDFATMYQQYPLAIIVPEDSPIKALSDLQGKKVGLPGEYGENWFYLLACMQEARLVREDLTIESIGYTQVAALTGHKVDAVVGFVNNDLVRFDESGFKVRLIKLDTPPLISVGLGALDQTIDTRAAELSKLLGAIEKGAKFCAENPEETVKLSEKYIPNLTEEEQRKHALATLNATMPLYLGKFGYQDPTRWDDMAKFMFGHGLLAKEIPATEVYTDKIKVG